MAFPENLQYIRARHALTQEQLAEQLSVSRQSVSKWESGLSFPEMDTLLRLCDLYDVTMDTLLRGSVEENLVEDTACYDRFMNTFIRRITGGVGAILAGVALMLLTLAAGLPDTIAVALFLLILTVAVVVLVASGIQYDNFCKKYPLIQDFYSQEEKDAFYQKFVWYIAGGIGAILFGVVAMLLFFSVFPEEEPYELLAGGAFLLVISGAVMSMVYAGMQEEKYKIWKYNRDNNPTPEAKQRKNLIGTICLCLMLTATAVYVGLGLTRGLWNRDFWIFAVGGILCAVVTVALDPYKGED